MATGLLETGPKLDWTRDNKIFDRYQIWKEKVELIFSSALEESSSKQKVSYLRYWMGEQGIPLVKKWTALGKLDFSSSEEDALSSGYILQNYWNLLDAEFRPKGNKLLSVIELWTRSRQGSKTLNEWLTYLYNLVESCDYGDSSERIIRDVLIIGCSTPFEAEWKFYSKNFKDSQSPEYPEEAPKEFHPQGLDYKSDILCTDILISEREML